MASRATGARCTRCSANAADARGQFEQLRDAARAASRELAEGLMMRTNRVAAHPVFEGRVLRSVLPQKSGAASAKAASVPSRANGSRRTAHRTPRVHHRRAAFRQHAVVRDAGGEPFHLHARRRGAWRHRGRSTFAASRRARSRFQSARAPARDAGSDSPPARGIRGAAPSRGRRQGADAADLRFLEKTPKNALRIPFLDAAFPDAQFIFLWREPRANLASIIEAWKAGRWVTYRGLDERADPWSLLLPPGWRAMRDAPLPEIAAFQWESANRIALDDLSKIDRSRWTTVTYEDLDCESARRHRTADEVHGDQHRCRARTAAGRAAAAFPSDPHAAGLEKWRLHEAVIEPQLPGLAHGDAPEGPQRRVLKPRFTSRAECSGFIVFLVLRWDSSTLAPIRPGHADGFASEPRAGLGSRRQTISSPFSF